MSLLQNVVRTKEIDNLLSIPTPFEQVCPNIAGLH